MRSIRIAHLVSPMDLYGKEKWLLAFLEHLNAEEFPSFVIPIVHKEPCPLVDEMTKHGVELHPIHMDRRFQWSAVRNIADIARRANAEIIHSHDYKADVMALLVGSKVKVKIMSTPHGWGNSGDLKLRFYNLIDELVLSCFDRVVPLSPDLDKSLIFVRRRRKTMISNFLDLSKFPAPTAYDEKLISYVGRLTELKRVDDAIRALALCHDRDIRLQIIGDGPLRGDLEALVQSLDLSSRVSFLGFHPSALDLLNRSALLVLPSLTEGMSRITMEAMGLGKPVVGTNISGIRVLVENGVTGLTVPVKNPKAIASAIDTLISNRELRERMGDAGRQCIRTRYSAEVIVHQYEQLYREIMHGSA